MHCCKNIEIKTIGPQESDASDSILRKTRCKWKKADESKWDYSYWIQIMFGDINTKMINIWNQTIYSTRIIRVWNVHHNQKFWADQFNTFWPYFYRRVTHSIRLNQKWPCSLVDGCPPISGNFWWKWPSICPPYCIHWHFCHGRHGQARYCGGQGHEFFIENFVKIAQKFQK